MTIAIASGPLPTPPLQQLTCEGCGVACDTSDLLLTSETVFAVCPRCWAEPRTESYALTVRRASDAVGHLAAKDAKNAILAAIERAVGIGDRDESP